MDGATKVTGEPSAQLGIAAQTVSQAK
jgi:hypothetical protein